MEKLVEAVKIATLDIIMDSKPMEIHHGTVTNTNPLEITVESKPYDRDFLILSRNVTDYKTEISFQGGTKDIGTIYNGLKEGEKVILLREQGGQKYLVWDRVG